MFISTPRILITSLTITAHSTKRPEMTINACKTSTKAGEVYFKTYHAFLYICSVQVTSCSWNSDQSLLATCSQDKVVQLWSISQSNVELQTTFSCITRFCSKGFNVYYCWLFSYHIFCALACKTVLKRKMRSLHVIWPLAIKELGWHVVVNVSFLWLSPVKQTDRAVRGPVDVTTCLLYTGAQGETFWLLQRTNTSASWTSGVSLL